jgi:hypothetical protein
VRDLFAIWLDYYRADRAAEKREAIERIPPLLRERLLLINQMPSMPAEGQVAAGARLQPVAQEIACMYARAAGRRTATACRCSLWA